MILFVRVDQFLIQFYFYYKTVQVGIIIQWLVESVKLMTKRKNSVILKSKKSLNECKFYNYFIQS